MNLYRLARWGRQRRPRRVPKATWYKATAAATEWFEVRANNIAEARAVCALWPLRSCDPTTGAQIVLHGRPRN